MKDTKERESMRLFSVCGTYIRFYRKDRPFASKFGVFGHISANSQLCYEI